MSSHSPVTDAPEITAALLARGFADLFDRISGEGGVVQQDSSLPPTARRALARLSGLCLEGGVVDDLGASVHVAMEMASRPFSAWGVPQFAAPFRYADVVLVNADLGVPTEDCRELARGSGSESAAQEELHHERLRSALRTYPAARRNKAYTALREFVVRNPAVRFDLLNRFVAEGGHHAAAQTLFSFYRPIPQSVLFGRAARRCGHCGGLLWPERDTAAYPDGRCAILQCRLANPTPRRGEDIDDPAAWRLGTRAVLAYWVGPGLAEIEIHDALATAGRNVELYPESDAADVGVDGMAIGIDVKTYASPLVLGARLTRDIGRFVSFTRRILAVPDDRLRTNPRYLEQLRLAYRGHIPLEFRTVSATISELAP